MTYTLSVLFYMVWVKSSLPGFFVLSFFPLTFSMLLKCSSTPSACQGTWFISILSFSCFVFWRLACFKLFCIWIGYDLEYSNMELLIYPPLELCIGLPHFITILFGSHMLAVTHVLGRLCPGGCIRVLKCRVWNCLLYSRYICSAAIMVVFWNRAVDQHTYNTLTLARH